MGLLGELLSVTHTIQSRVAEELSCSFQVQLQWIHTFLSLSGLSHTSTPITELKSLSQEHARRVSIMRFFLVTHRTQIIGIWTVCALLKRKKIHDFFNCARQIKSGIIFIDTIVFWVSLILYLYDFYIVLPSYVAGITGFLDNINTILSNISVKQRKTLLLFRSLGISSSNYTL